MSSSTEVTATVAATTTTEQATQNEATTVAQLLQHLISVAATQAQQTKELHRSLRLLSVSIEKEQRKVRSTKPKRTVTQKPVDVSPAMTKFLQGQSAESDNGRYTRQTMMRAVSSYIKTHKLQLEADKKRWKPDATLASLFSLDKKQEYTFMNVNGLLSRVVVAPKA